MATKLIPREGKEQIQEFSIDGSSLSGIIESLDLDFLDRSDKKSEKLQEVSKENKLRMEMYKLTVEFFFLKETLSLKDFIITLEKCIILRALSEVNGNQKEAARFLGIKYTTLNEKIKKYKIDFKKSPYLI
jgi:DNA-binding NtrC family response regulator